MKRLQVVAMCVVAVSLVLASWLGRYTLVSQGNQMLRMDRWTGEVCVVDLRSRDNSTGEDWCWNR